MRGIKLIVLLFIIGIFVFPLPAFATTVTNRADGAFLLNGQPYFPVGFWPQNLSPDVLQSDWVDLKNSGINFSVTGLADDWISRVKNAGLNIVVYLGGDSNNPDNDVLTAKTLAQDKLLGYFALDEPVGNTFPLGGINPLDPNQAKLFNYYGKIFQNDPDHFIWTNHGALRENVIFETDMRSWNKYTKSRITGADYYGVENTNNMQWQAGWFTNQMKSVQRDVLSQVPEFLHVGIIMILSGYNSLNLYGKTVSFNYTGRLNYAIDSIINGASGLLFYIDGADNYLRQTGFNWNKYKSSQAYSEIKQVASVLNQSYSGLTGINNTTITSLDPAVKLLAKNGTDGSLYIFMINKSVSSDVSAKIINLPTGYYFDFLQNQRVSLSPTDTIVMPPNGVKILKYISGSLLPGDIDQNGKVDIFDYNLLITNFNKNGAPGFSPADIDQNGRVDIFDYNILITNFGKTQ